VALRWLGPVAAVSGPRPPRPAVCALTGITEPLDSGHHFLVTQYVRGGHVGTVTTEIDAG
jgi:hypothetical protein